MFDTPSESKASAPVQGAVEVVQGSNGQVQDKPLSQLSTGDHTIQFDDGRQFLVHVPKTESTASLPAMFVFSGSAEPIYNIKDFAPESGMSGVADEDPNHPFVVVYPLMKEHKIGIYSDTPAFAFNASGSLIGDNDRIHAGYNDIDYVKSIVNLMPQITNVDSSHKDWGAVAFSQGGVFLNDVVATIPNLFPSVGLVGTAMQKGYKYDVKDGNAKNVAIVELLGDKDTLPIRGLTTQSWKYDKDYLIRFFLRDLNIGPLHGNSVIDNADPLAAIHNEEASPMLQNKLYTHSLGKQGKDYSVTTSNLATPVASDKKDFEIDYVPKDPTDNRRVTVWGLTQAQHAYPAPLYGPRTNATTKYTEFDASRRFAQLFEQYNDKVHGAQQADLSQPH